MRTRSRSSSSPEHWSKDYVEHLRTVHFALVTISVGLILLLSSARYDLKKAAEQMTEVTQIVHLVNLGPSETYSDSSGAVAYSPWFSARSSRENFTFHVAEPNLFECVQVVPRIGEFRHLDSLSMPNTIGAFAVWWDSLLQRDQRIISIIRLGPEGTLHDKQRSMTKHITITDIGYQNGNPIQVAIGGKCDLNPSSREPISISGDNGRYRFSFPVDVHHTWILNQDLIGKMIGHARKGFFSESFPDLAEATRDRENLDFAILSPQLYTEGTKGEETFEAFGIRIPSTHVTGWGLLTIVVLQLYFLVYLRALDHKLKIDDPAWDVPWIAMDESRTARVLFFGSIVLLPSFASLLAAGRADLLIASETPLTGFDYAKLSAILFLFFVSLFLGGLCWRFRPKLSQPASPAEVLEDQGSGI